MNTSLKLLIWYRIWWSIWFSQFMSHGVWILFMSAATAPCLQHTSSTQTLNGKKHWLVPCVFTRILLGFCLPNMQNPDVWFKVILFGGLVTSPFLLGEVLVSLHLFESLFDHGFVRLPDNFEGIWVLLLHRLEPKRFGDSSSLLLNPEKLISGVVFC